jgi:glycosyltransferase involved in cell wall biosynthesis
MNKVLIVSHSSINAPHRKPYDLLGRDWGWDVHIAVPSALELTDGRRKLLDPRGPDDAYTLHPLRVYLPDNGRFALFSGLGGLVRRLRPDVIYVEYDPGSTPVLHSALLARFARCKVVAFTPENIFRNRIEDAYRALRERHPKEALRDLTVAALDALGKAASDGLACVNQEGARIFRDERRWDQPISIVPLGTDLDLFHPLDASGLRANLGLKGVHVVGYFGRLIPGKGVHLLIEALAKLPPDVHLLLDMFKNFEPGSYAAELMTRAKALGLTDRIVTIDVPHEQVPMYMNCCDVIAIPSLSTPRWIEQFGRVVPEAMACGVPVVGSDSGNIPAIIGDAGVVVPEGDVQALAAAILRLRSNTELAETLRKRAIERVRELWSVDVQARFLAELFATASGQVLATPSRNTRAAPSARAASVDP